MKKLIIVITVLSCWTGVYSQSKIPWNDRNTQGVINGSPFIFEGVVIDTMYYNGDSGSRDIIVEYGVGGKPLVPIKPLTAVKVQITHVFRGDLNQGTIEIVDDIGGFWNNGVFMHMLIGERDKPMQPGTKGIFFCNKSTYKLSPMKTDNEIRVVSIEGIGGQSGDGVYYYFDKKFNTKEDFYEFLSKYPNITIPKDSRKK